MRGVPVSKAPVTIVQRAGLTVEQRATEWGSVCSVQDAAGLILYRGRKESALAWLEGYLAAMRAYGHEC